MTREERSHTRNHSNGSYSISRLRRLTGYAAAVLLLALSGCQTTKEVHEQVASVSVGGPTELISRPIHLGDNMGNIDDVRRFKDRHPKSAFVGDTHTWPFTVNAMPEGPATLDATVFSVSAPIEEDSYRCPTVVSFNGTEIFDMRRNKHAGGNRFAQESISIDPTLFKVGKNEVVITEQMCAGGLYFNDSVVTGLKLTLPR